MFRACKWSDLAYVNLHNHENLISAMNIPIAPKSEFVFLCHIPFLFLSMPVSTQMTDLLSVTVDELAASSVLNMWSDGMYNSLGGGFLSLPLVNF